jgi:hypothetical protein
LPDELVAEAMHVTKARAKTEIIRKGLRGLAKYEIRIDWAEILRFQAAKLCDTVHTLCLRWRLLRASM